MQVGVRACHSANILMLWHSDGLGFYMSGRTAWTEEHRVYSLGFSVVHARNYLLCIDHANRVGMLS
jgi:hypothetical protein